MCLYEFIIPGGKLSKPFLEVLVAQSAKESVCVAPQEQGVGILVRIVLQKLLESQLVVSKQAPNVGSG